MRALEKSVVMVDALDANFLRADIDEARQILDLISTMKRECTKIQQTAESLWDEWMSFRMSSTTI